MNKFTAVLAVLILILLFKAGIISAYSGVAGNSAELTVGSAGYGDIRVILLKNYLVKQNSPLAPYAQNLVDTADENNLDWRLVPAITGVESSFGKRIPKNSFNAYGWANGNYSFKSWDESIKIVADTLEEKYIQKGAVSINQIARRYAPPSNTWAGKVKFLMKKIDPLPVSFTI